MIYENFVFNSLLRNGIKAGFWNIQNRHEVDFVYEKDGDIVGIEVKSKLTNNSLTLSMKKFIEQMNPAYLYVFNENIDSDTMVENTRVIFTNFINCVQLTQHRKMVNPAPLLKRRGFVQSSLCTLHPRPDQK